MWKMGRTRQLALAVWQYRRTGPAGAPSLGLSDWTSGDGWILSCIVSFWPDRFELVVSKSQSLTMRFCSLIRKWHERRTAEVGRCLSLLPRWLSRTPEQPYLCQTGVSPPACLGPVQNWPICCCQCFKHSPVRGREVGAQSRSRAIH